MENALDGLRSKLINTASEKSRRPESVNRRFIIIVQCFSERNHLESFLHPASHPHLLSSKQGRSRDALSHPSPAGFKQAPTGSSNIFCTSSTIPHEALQNPHRQSILSCHRLQLSSRIASIFSSSADRRPKEDESIRHLLAPLCGLHAVGHATSSFADLFLLRHRCQQRGRLSAAQS
jgi:hypothetical protein